MQDYKQEWLEAAIKLGPEDTAKKVVEYVDKYPVLMQHIIDGVHTVLYKVVVDGQNSNIMAAGLAYGLIVTMEKIEEENIARLKLRSDKQDI